MKSFDGFWMGDPDGNVVEIFDPAFWRIDRAIIWLFTSRERKTKVPMCVAGTVCIPNLCKRHPHRSVRARYMYKRAKLGWPFE